MQKLEMSVTLRHVRWLRFFACVLAGSITLNLVQGISWENAALERDLWKKAAFQKGETIVRLAEEKAASDRRLDEMAALAESWRFTALYDQCIDQALYVGSVWDYRIEYDRSKHEIPGLTGRCLSEATRYQNYVSDPVR